VSPGKPTPQALIADNDLGLGQLVELISHSPVWQDSAIFVVEDDSQDGADHVDAHRMPAFAISPYARRGAVVHTRYDQYSALRTIELILGMHPLSLNDALATPMYDAFTTEPDLEPYTAIQPEQSLDERNPVSSAAMAAVAESPATIASASLSSSAWASVDPALALQLPFDQLDLVPQQLSDAVLWHSVYGWDSTPPPPGPGASPSEEARTAVALDAYRAHLDIGEQLALVSLPDADDADNAGDLDEPEDLDDG
jgi:hypothetical protein